MNLEQRVETLEQELQVLKNQIQATLLDLQEFMLTNSFPTLRADEQAAPSQPAPAPAPPQRVDVRPAAEPAASPEELPASSHHRQIPVQEFTDSPPGRAQNPGSDVQVRVNKIGSVDQIGPVDQTRPVDQIGHHQQQHEPYDNTSYLETDEPVHSRPPRRNGHRPQPTVRHEPGWFDLDEDDLDDDYPPDLNGWVPPFLTNPGNMPDSIPNADWANLYMLEEWVQKRIEAVGAYKTQSLIERYSEEGRIDPLLRVMMLQLVSIITEQQDMPASDNTREPSREQSGNVTHDMVLKMIARLQNTGLTRRKNHG